MKRKLASLMILVCAVASAQNINDVLQYGLEDLQGTARFKAMGGAFGALGGDLSALNINPAGSAVFNNSQFSVSANIGSIGTDANYFGTNVSSDNSISAINQAGAVFVFKSTGNSPWNKLSLGVNYDMVQDFDNETYIAGNSSQGIDNYFLDYANGVPFGDLLLRDGEYLEEAYLDIGASLGYGEQQAFLGYFGGLLDPADPDNTDGTAYVSNAQYSNLSQRYNQFTDGYNSKFTVNFAGEYNNRLYLGASINLHSVFYDRYTEFTESNYDPASEIQFTNFDNFLHTEGGGFSFSLGTIAKLNEFLRLGVSYQSPTWYRLEDETYQRINSDLADEDIGYINQDIRNLYEAYTIKIPAKVTASAAIIFGKQGLLSVDYGFQDMSNAQLRPKDDPSFASENDYISQELGGVSTLRLGGEYRIKQISLRAGYRLEGSPYANGNTIGDLNVYSGGVGFSFGPNRIDLALSRSERDYNTQLFQTGLTNSAYVTKTNTFGSIGYTLNF